MSSKRNPSIRLDLGLRNLLPEWKQMFSVRGLREDFISGAGVACIALPLSLAIALASGVPPAIGLISAIVGGVFCTLFGGTKLQVSGPAAAMTVLIASVVQQYGPGGILIVGLGCGIIQLTTGVLGLGQLVRFVPVPVAAGFTAGIGAIILIGQLPSALGLPPPDQSHVLDVILHIRDLIHETRLSSLGLSMGTLLVALLLPHYFPKFPAPFVAVLIPTLVVAVTGLQVQTIANVPDYFPQLRMPRFPNDNLFGLIGTAFVFYMVASLETLLSSSAVDKLAKNHHHDPDQELIGQGLGNMFCSLFGGIPVTGVIARSALNIQMGAETRRSALVQVLILGISMLLFAPVISRIPVAVLAGILLSVALRMLHPREFLQVWHSYRGEAAIYLITFFVIVFIDLIIGVQAGVIAALVIAAIRFGQGKANVEIFESQGPPVVSLDGPLTFLSSQKLESIRSRLRSIDPKRGLILDFSGVPTIDVSGASQLVELLEFLMQQGVRFVLKGLSPECHKIVLSLDRTKKLADHVVFNQVEIAQVLGLENMSSGLDRLIYGVEKFRRELRSGYEGLFKNLAGGQSPHTLFITCSDSRIDPNLITSTEPGELFIVRNVGNIIPPFGVDGIPAEGAAVEFAISILGIQEIVVCGHSGCGAMKAILSENFFSEDNKKKYPSMVNWLQVGRGIKEQLPERASAEKAAELNSIIQLENLKTYPVIKQKLQQGAIRLHAWYYNIGEGVLSEWDDTQKMFTTIGSKDQQMLEKRIEAGVQYQYPLNLKK